jgi:hypothetical protein
VSLDEALARIEQLTAPGRHAWGPLTEYEDDLPPRFQAGIGPLVADLRERVLQLAAQLGTDARRMSRARSVRAMVTSATIRLEDSRARGLRGYGTVDPSVHEQLDPVLDDLMERFRAISRLAAPEAPSQHSTERK